VRLFSFHVVIYAFLMGVCGVKALFSAPETKEMLQQVVVKGLIRVDKAFVLSKLPFKKGDMIEGSTLSKASEVLFKTGLFADVKGRFDKGVLLITVDENKLINQVAFEGNQKVSRKVLQKEVDLKSRQVYTVYQVQKAVEKIKAIYRAKGYASVEVVPQIIQRPQGRVDIVLEIAEGASQQIEKILFKGNNVFGNGTLKDVLLTKESRWYRFLSSSDTYEPDRLAYDRELLHQHYMNHGYLDAVVDFLVAEVTRDKSRFYLTFQIYEGKPYVLKKVDLKSDIKDVDVKAFQKHIEIQKGDVCNISLLEKSVTNLTNALNKKGHFCSVTFDLKKRPEDYKVEVIFKIIPEKPFSVRHVLIQGNVQTNDEVIRRECVLNEGDPITVYQLQKTRMRLMNLDFFKKLDVRTEDVEQAGRLKDVIIDVEDKPTGQLMLSGGYSTHASFFFEVKASERNFMGTGKETDASVMIGRRSKGVSLGVSNPYAFERNMELGGNVFFQQVKRDTREAFKGGYQENQIGLGVHLGYHLSERLFERFRYSIKRENYTNNNLKSVFYEKLGKHSFSTVGHDYIFDWRDNVVQPTKNGFVTLKTDYCGLGGSVRYLSNQLKGAYYMSVSREYGLVFKMQGSFGLLSEVGKPLRVNDHFFIGGMDLRGFADVGIGPRDSSTSDAIGGRKFVLSTLELSMPIGPPDFGVSLLAFNDGGALWSSFEKNRQHGHLVTGNAFYWRTSLGTGLRWRSPFGLIGISWAKPLRYLKSIDQREYFRFEFGTAF